MSKWPLARVMATSIARPLIAKRQIEIARQVGADALAHGATRLVGLWTFGSRKKNLDALSLFLTSSLLKKTGRQALSMTCPAVAADAVKPPPRRPRGRARAAGPVQASA